MRILRLTFTFILLLLVIGCKKDEVPCPPSQTEELPIPIKYESPEDIVAKLSGFIPIKDSVSILNRGSAENRQIAREYLQAILAPFCDTVMLHQYNTGANVWGLIESWTASDSIIIIGGHFDSVGYSPGANDNATGTAAAFEVAKRISQHKLRRYKLYVVFFDEEELGLRGSNAFAQMCLDRSLKIHSVHTIDQMGWDADGDRSIEMEGATPELETLYNQAKSNIGFIGEIHQTYAPSDHAAFRAKGFPATGLTEEYINGDTTPYYHHPDDTYETINFEFMESSIQLTTEAIRILMTD